MIMIYVTAAKEVNRRSEVGTTSSHVPRSLAAAGFCSPLPTLSDFPAPPSNFEITEPFQAQLPVLFHVQHGAQLQDGPRAIWVYCTEHHFPQYGGSIAVR